VNGRRVNIPSFLIKQGDVVELREKSRDLDTVRSAIDRLNQKQIPAWIYVDSENMRGVVQALPKRHDLTMSFHEQLIVELYSK
jgi:small subunit ribosomal protein S4